ncbi:MAG TPA: COX15/CtaA family protein [Anaeromyxobacteraceae bacterium]|nr:COX15/CtaA family protein [Anaeromyxobacteraceae bacterium]
MKALRRFAWSVVGFNVAVIAWGAFVRATGSGAGCGRHWPTCKGEVIPRAPALETAIEFTHRATSGLSLLLVIALVVWTRRALPRGHAARRAALAGLGLMVVEALLGAALVLYGWVARDTSPERGWVMAVHLTNTLLLLGALTLAAAWIEAAPGPLARRPGGVAGALLLAAGAMVLAGASGAVAALGDTLYPASTLGEALQQDVDASARLLLRLRLLHPPLAVIAAAAIAFAGRLAARAVPEGGVRRAAAVATALAVAQLGLGALNLVLLAPVGLQLAHLALADLTWIALAALAARALAPAPVA